MNAASSSPVTTPRIGWAPRLAALALGAAAAGSLAYWVLRVLDAAAPAVPPPVAAAAPLPEAADPAVVARALAPAGGAAGSASPDRGELATPARLVLSGVAAGTSGRGTAVIAVDGAPPRPYLVGAQVAEGLVLQSVQGRRAQLGPALGQAASVVLELPPLEPTAR